MYCCHSVREVLLFGCPFGVWLHHTWHHTLDQHRCSHTLLQTMLLTMRHAYAVVLVRQRVMCAFGWWNRFPAAWFMGNSGAHGLGAALACVAAVTGTHAVLAPLSAVFAVEALSCVLQVGWWSYTKRTRGQGEKLLKRAPLHHHLEFSGWHETKVVFVAVAVQILICVGALMMWPRSQVWV